MTLHPSIRAQIYLRKCSYDLIKIVELEVKQRIENKEWEELWNERNSISKNEESIGRNKTSEISRPSDDRNNKRNIGDEFSRDSKSREHNRKTIKRATSKTRYRKLYGNSTIREHDSQLEDGTDRQYDSRKSKRNVKEYDEGVEQTTLFNLTENNDETKENEGITLENHNPPIPSFKIPDNLKDDSIGLKKKYEENIDAIKLLKQLEYEDRDATDEEKIILAKYNGWGGLDKAFKQDSPQYEELKELLTDEEFKSAEDSVNTAFYTEPYIIDFIYKAIERFGITGKCNILDPAARSWKFFRENTYRI